MRTSMDTPVEREIQGSIPPAQGDELAALLTDFRTEEELVLLARGEHSRPAITALVLRLRAWMDSRVARLARRARLQWEDIEDAQQGAFFVLLRAIERFDPGRGAAGQTCRFRTFLALKLRGYILDLAKHLQREEAHLDRSAAAGREAAVHSGPGATACGCHPRVPDDPAVAAEQRELADQLWEAVGQLDEPARWLLDGRAAGFSFQALAAQTGVPCDRLKYRWRRTLGRLAARLGTGAGAGHRRAAPRVSDVPLSGGGGLDS
jgi:RNA polymerase sigma factor (sigma-70 family)